MIAGFEQPSEGEIRIDGEDVAGLPPHKRPTNTVFQSYALFPHLSVEDNVAFGLKRKKVGKDEIAERVATELQRVGLAAEANRRPSQLSGGMQQRVALARALVNLPKVLLLDEPLGALDLKLRKGLQVELKRIQREVGITFVYVTHDQEEALTMSDRIAVMNRGRVEQVDVPEEIYDRPTTTFVAGFIGVSNLMPANGRRCRQGPARQRARGRRRHRRPRPRRGLRRGGAAGEAADRGPASGAGAAADGLPRVEGVVESSLYLGTATQIVVDLGDDVRMTVLVPNADEAERQRLPGGGARVGPELGARAHARGHASRRGMTRQRATGTCKQGGRMQRNADRMRSRGRGSRCWLVAWRWRRWPWRSGSAACGGGGGGIEGGGSGEAETVKLEGKPTGQPDDLQLAALHRQRNGPELRKGDRDLASSTSKTSTPTKNSSPRCSRCSQQGRIRRPQHLRPRRLRWSAKCTNWATCRTSTNPRCPNVEKNLSAEPAGTRRSTRTAATRCRGRAG